MRLDRAIIVAKKDLSEFAKNRYIMMTIVMMPLIASVILPIVYVVPITHLSRQSSADLSLQFQITNFRFEISNLPISPPAPQRFPGSPSSAAFQFRS